MGSTQRLSGAHEGLRGLAPGMPLRGGLRVPGSKSVVQRALLAAALAPGVSHLRGLSAGGDVAAAQAWLSGLQ